jgi:hypothetical protein
MMEKLIFAGSPFAWYETTVRRETIGAWHTFVEPSLRT